MGKSVAALLGPGLVGRRLSVERSQIVLVRAHLEASEGLGMMFAERGGELTLAAPEGRERELDAFIDDLCEEIGAVRLVSNAETLAPGRAAR